ncbi:MULTISPECIES: hypothetical protein [Clostridium]|uniref:Uncharacterized protein n=1 Tax=Clostridium frigoriphilum TaxID=443253 RepID=A0ABU7UJ43_9CLOT|nr:hypothetical protein [Clostridium sp. DSM 17811]MBU3098350.1 hypothetical protein [Clostridium sp. DSM 17811]
MAIRKTRCKQCISKDKKATQEPCNKCAEILSSPIHDYENEFLDASRNLMPESKENIDEKN